MSTGVYVFFRLLSQANLRRSGCSPQNTEEDAAFLGNTLMKNPRYRPAKKPYCRREARQPARVDGVAPRGFCEKSAQRALSTPVEGALGLLRQQQCGDGGRLLFMGQVAQA